MFAPSLLDCMQDIYARKYIKPYHPSIFTPFLLYIINVFNFQTAQSREDTKDENTFSKEVDEVRKQLIKEFKHSEDQATVGYYNFVLHPTSFGETIQNMFFVSFLLRDGHVRLIVDETTNLPVLSKLILLFS